MNPTEPIAWRVSWSEEYLPAPLAVITLTQKIFAHAEPHDVADILGTPKVARLDVLFLPAGSATPFALQERGAAWIAARPGDGEPAEAIYRGIRILWRPGSGGRPGRALAVGATEHAQDALAGVAAFAIWHQAREVLHDQVQSAWTTLPGDVALTHGLRPRDLRRQLHVNTMTRAAVFMRMRFVELQRALEPPAGMSGPAQRIFSELCLAARAQERLLGLDDAIEVIEDIYDTANDRLSEYRYFIREYFVEWLIVFFLAVQFAEMVFELWD